MNPYETNIERILNQREVSNNHLERHPFIIDTIDPIVEVKHVPSNEHVPTESKEIDTVTEWCSSCELEVELPQQFKNKLAWIVRKSYSLVLNVLIWIVKTVLSNSGKEHNINYQIGRMV